MALFAKKKETRLAIRGMTCANCQRHVGEALRAVPGVAAAQVDLLFHRAVVSHDPERAPTDALVAAVRAAGYDAAPLEA
ncbi:MAG TPA: heavy metal-associated domain-containing protein [Candidatus Thermoplasmatota archaeon]|nr:heavy metal-associated domain-containing protein [Candidatus Thermoplasmatota archaeon]